MAYRIKVFEFTATVRGYRNYRTFWKPEHKQVLNCYQGKNNAFDRFAIMVCVEMIKNLLDIFRWKFKGDQVFY